jgi:sugar phosphate isomerase/epimerase
MLKIKAYAARAFKRARELGSLIIVFGSGAARMVPDGWPREKAEEQLVEVIRLIGPLARAQAMTLALEPLNRGESNILNSVAEGLEFMRRAKAAGVTILCDYYHLALEKEPLENLDAAKGLLSHVHIAEPEGRTPPRPGMTDFRPFFRKLKDIGYNARIAIECNWQSIQKELAPSLAFLRRQWAEA